MTVNVVLDGNVGKDPQTKQFANGKSITTFSVGVSQGYFDQQNQWVDQGTMWVDVEPITKKAESQLQFITKGCKVVVSGLLSQRFYTNKVGQQASSLRIAAHVIGIINKPQQTQQAYHPQATQMPAQQSAQQYVADPWATTEPDF